MKFDMRKVEYIKTNRELRYLVKIIHWFYPDENNVDIPRVNRENPHCWNVYVVIFKDCKIYDSLKSVLDSPDTIHTYKNSDGTTSSFKVAYDNLEGVFDFDWHCGATYMDYVLNNAIQIGDDYMHCGDELEMNSDCIPSAVEFEAKKLYEYTEGLIKNKEEKDK